MFSNLLVPVAASLIAVLCPSEVGAYGAAHVGYTHVGPNGVQHYGATAANGPNGHYTTEHAGAYGNNGAYRAGYGTANTPSGYHAAGGYDYHYSSGYNNAHYAYVR